MSDKLMKAEALKNVKDARQSSKKSLINSQLSEY